MILRGEQREPRFERAALRWLGRLFLEKPMPYALAATCVELVAELRGPAPEPRGEGAHGARPKRTASPLLSRASPECCGEAQATGCYGVVQTYE